MNTLALLFTDVALLWLTLDLYNNKSNTALGVVGLGLFFLFVVFTIFEFMHEVGSGSGGEDGEDED